MQRRSTKHGPRLDDELKRETSSLERGAPVESRSDESREQEAPADDERLPSARTAPPDALGPDEETARAELSRHLRLSLFPAQRSELLEEAAENHAPTPVLEALRELPARTYSNVYDVWEALREAREGESTG